MPKEDAPSKGRQESPSDAANTFSHDRALPEHLHQYDQNRQLISQSLGPSTTPQGEGKPPIASSRRLRSDHDARSEDFNSFISASSELMEESLVGTQNLQTGNNEQDTLQHDPNSILQDFLEKHPPPSSDRRLLVNGTSFNPPLPISRHSRSRAPVVLARHRNPAPAPHRRASTATARSWTDQNSVFDYSQYTESDFATSTAPLLGPDPHGEGAGFLPCEFVGYTRCDKRYDLEDTEQWINHIINDHLRHQLPTTCACWFCDDYVFDTKVNGLDDETNFRQRLYHIRDHITYNGYAIFDMKHDYNFLGHLWSLGIITQKAYDAALRYREGPPSDVHGIYRYDYVPPERQDMGDRKEGLVTIGGSREEKRSRRRDKRRNDDRPTLGKIEERANIAPPDSVFSTMENAELNTSHQVTQRTSESYLPSSRNLLSILEVLDEDGTHHGDNILTYQTGGLTEDSQSRLEDPRNPRLSPLGTNELPDSHERQSISDRNVLNSEMDVENDVPALDSAAAGVSTRQDIQAPTDSGYDSGLHPKAMEVENQDDKTWYNGLYSAQTTYTDSNISTSEDRGYISDFAAELAQVGEQLNLSIVTAENILKAIPDLLRAFALRIGYNANSTVHRDISVFVHRHRFQIRKSLRSKLPFEETGSDTDDSETIRDTSLNGEFSISRFLQEPDAQDYLPMGTSADAEDEQDIEMDDHQFRDIIQNTEAYRWLIAALKREANLVRSAPDIMQEIESDILGFLPEFHRVSRREAPQAYTIELQLDWNPLLFARQQEYSSPPDLSLQCAITLTGSRDNAQALTARQYLAQTWPNTGDYIMDLVTNVVRAAHNPQSSCVLPDGTDITVNLAGDQFIVTAMGIADTLVEVGQQFAWLGAALRTSPYESGIATCVPAIERIEYDSAFIGQKISVAVTFTISEPFLRSEELLPGACWLPMFRNPVMVAGYPVRSRLVTDLGLEMPLNMMAELSGSTRADLFDGKIFLKGFSTMLIATKQAHDIIVWHYFYNADRERLSYFDHALEDVDNISFSSLNSARHVIGWCEDCKLFTGDPVLAGNIQRSRLPPPHAGCLLEKINLSFSQFITGGVSMAVGVKDVPPHVTLNGYIPELRHLATRYVVLWDEADKRGWLVNGTNALLHIVRASLQHWAKDDFSASFMFDESKMADTTDHKPGSASRILSDPDNLELEIHVGKIERFDEEETKQKGSEEEYTRTEKRKKGYYLLGDLIELRLKALNQIMDHQVQKAGTNGINIKRRIRTHLEGWDFREIATDEVLRPRVATLQALGYGWVDFVRSIDAITLLGRGFGEIIQPSEDDMCPKWKRLPTQEYFLAVTTSDLINIMEKFGNMYTEPKQLVPDLAWHSPDDLLAVLNCRCQRKRQLAKRLLSHSREHRSPVQVPFPVRSGLILPLKSPQEFHEDGAVVFGYHISWKYPWSEDGSKGVMEVQSGLQRSRFETSETDTSNSSPRASEATASDSQFSPSGSATPPTSMNLSIGRSDISTQASTADDRARRLRLEKRRISRNR